MANIVNIIAQFLSYSDNGGNTDNPQQRNFDWSRRLSALKMSRPSSDVIYIPPGESSVLFDGLRTTTLNATSVMDLTLLTGSTYQIKVTAGPSGFRTARTITGLAGCAVTINNNSVATFNFAGATFGGGIQVGDILRISGQCTNDTGPYSFNSLNAGQWRIIGISGAVIQAVRAVGRSFEGVTETIVTVGAGQVEIYSSAGIQKGDKFEIKGGFSITSRRVYEVLDAKPTAIQFVSTLPIPEETGVAYPDPITNGDSLVFYVNAKRLVYIESNQDVVVKFDDDTSESVKINPITPGDPTLVGFMSKFGSTYKLEVVNKSVNTAEVLFFFAE